MRFLPFLAALGLTLASCGGPEQQAAPPAIPVETITVKAEAVPNVVELPGRVEPVRVAEVRARVTGIVQQRLFREGTNVSEGQPLFRIDPSELRASYAQTEASLARARATAANAAAVVERYRPLVEENAISRQEFDAAVAASREAAANVAQIEAQLRAAALQLGYTTVRAPIAGRVGRAQVTEGALVSQAEGTLLTRIEQMSPVYVTFSQSASEILRLRRAMEQGEIDLPEGRPVEVRLQFADGTEYPIPGVIDFLDQSVDPTTGTVALRAEFPNPESLLLPGEFVRARVVAGHFTNGIAVPQRAVTVGENGGSVYVVDKEGNAAVRPVALGEMIGERWVITDGLAPGDVVITSNLQKLRPGVPVQPVRRLAEPTPAPLPRHRIAEVPQFFIGRPIFAWVIALGILLAGVITLRGLPIEQYPDIAPPSLTISATYPGADAETLEHNVTQIIEQQLNGVDGVLYMASSSASNGLASITVTFESGTDIDIAQTEVQNRLSTVEARLPEQVRQQGITVRQANSGFLMLVALTSKTGSLSATDLGNVASIQVVDELRRVPGVGDILLFGSQYAMRIWLDPDRLASYGLSPSAVLAAIREQNSQTAGSSLGAKPYVDGQQITATIVTQDRFSTVREFEEIILRAETGGATVRLADVARVELGAQDYTFSPTLNGTPMAGMGVQLATGANALAAAEGVRERMAEIGPGLPADVAWSIPYDTTPFVQLSIKEVVVTLAEAMLLVFLVMFLFLQNWRATVIPTLVVPVALAGACLGLWVFGFSINVLSLFGMVLAIGILVDDAIVVIENVERIMSEEGLDPVAATRKAMGQITGAIIGITLVLVAVFVPMAFFPGSTGGIYRQFSVTLAISIFFSALLALTLTPALCATFLKPIRHGPPGGGAEAELAEADLAETEAKTTRGWRRAALTFRALRLRFFARFNAWFERTTERYGRTNDRILSRPMRALAAFVLLCGITVLLFMRLPTAFLPTEDQGEILVVVQAPPGATADRTEQAIEKVNAFLADQPEVADVVTIRGFSFYGRGQNNAIMFVPLIPWEERTDPESSASALATRAMATFAGLDDAVAFAIQRPPISALGNASGFSFKLEDRQGLGRQALLAARDQLLAMAAQSDVVVNLRPDEQPATPQVRVDVDRVQARALGLSIADVNTALSINFGSAYANDFTRQGRVLQVLVQADAPFRMTPDDVLSLRIPNERGELVPFSSFATAEWTAGPPSLARYNGYPALTLSGEAAPGKSSGTALAEMERLASQLPQGIGYEWTGISFEEKQSAGQIGLLLSLSVIVVFLLLAALYESWAVPLAVLLIVPAGVLGSVLFSFVRDLSADVYFNVGLITIIGLAAKNAILIVEFAIEEEEQRNRSPLEAVKAAARLRLRPIIMTSLAFILGMVPLVLASGAGAASRIAVGTGVMGGMIAATAIGIFMIPVLYLLVRTYVSRKDPSAAGHLEEGTAAGPSASPEGERP